MSQVARKVREIIARQALLEEGEVHLTSSLEDLGIDSLGLVEAIFAIEEAFDISVPFNPQDVGDTPGFDITNVASIIAAVEGLIARKGA